MLRPMHPVERLLNLTALLLESSRPLTFAQIRERIPAYGQREVDTAKRMFERDKDLLRETGIPIELVPTDPFEIEEGYRIPKERYYLPELDFAPEEMSALLIAAQTPAAEGEAEQAALKLQAATSGAALGEPPAGPVAAGPAGEARVAFSPEVGWWAVAGIPDARVERTRDDGWVEVAVPGGGQESMVSWVLSFGPDVEALAPQELRDGVRARLEAAVAAL